MSVLPSTTAPTETELEFDRQVDALALTGLPGLLDVKDECFRAMLEPLRDLLPPESARGTGIPFVVVVPEAPLAEVLPSVHTLEGDGGTTLSPREVAAFAPLPELDVPAGPYLLLDVETGDETGVETGVETAGAAAAVAGAGRTPLTLAEGVAVLLCDCGVRRAGASFLLLGSRDPAGRHPALRRTGGGGPTLTREPPGRLRKALGTASCGGRRAP
jgi:Family of unknown function (DUF5701)